MMQTVNERLRDESIAHAVWIPESEVAGPCR